MGEGALRAEADRDSRRGGSWRQVAWLCSVHRSLTKQVQGSQGRKGEMDGGWAGCSVPACHQAGGLPCTRLSPGGHTARGKLFAEAHIRRQRIKHEQSLGEHGSRRLLADRSWGEELPGGGPWGATPGDPGRTLSLPSEHLPNALKPTGCVGEEALFCLQGRGQTT